MNGRSILPRQSMALAVAAILGGCAPGGPALGPSPYDATYAGSTTLVGFSSPDWHCYWDAPPITVVNGRFTAELDGAKMTVPVKPDGTFDAYASRPVYSQTKYQSLVHATGRIADGGLAATVHDPRCTFRLDYARH
ncbi:MAG: hypothetical protein ABI369_14075 [Acetobacteraceae bacterium]